MKSTEWTVDIEPRLWDFLESLEKPETQYSFLPCVSGVTPWGREISLGFSCFALRVFCILGWWDELDNSSKQGWIDFINSFFVPSIKLQESGNISERASGYVDISLNRCLIKRRYSGFLHSNPRTALSAGLRVLKESFKGIPRYSERVIVAETKQAIASLAEVGAVSPEPFQEFPTSSADIVRYLSRFDWSKPWDAGGQAATVAVFLNTEGPRFLQETQLEDLVQTMRNYYRSLADPSTGAYFRGRQPTQRNLVNGAMKVITALNWLGEPIHYPKQLIDTTLAAPPKPEGCDLVDSIYVLYGCSLQTKYRRQSVIEYVKQLLELIRAHYNQDGGFSYNIGCAQKWYYGAPISKGLNESDLHGTFLLVWALSMIFEILEDIPCNTWNIIKP